MPKYIVELDEIRVHCVPVLAATREAAQREAERIVQADRTTWYDHTEPLCVGDAHTSAEWDAEQESLARMGTSGQPGPFGPAIEGDHPRGQVQGAPHRSPHRRNRVPAEPQAHQLRQAAHRRVPRPGLLHRHLHLRLDHPQHRQGLHRRDP